MIHWVTDWLYSLIIPLLSLCIQIYPHMHIPLIIIINYIYFCIGLTLRDYQSALRRFRSLSVTPSKKERPQWTGDAIRKKYTPEKTIELYDFSPEFETADLNQMLEPYQHHKCASAGTASNGLTILVHWPCSVEPGDGEQCSQGFGGQRVSKD